MAATHTAPDLLHPEAQTAALLINLPSLSIEAFDQVLDHLTQAFPSESMIVATPDEMFSAEEQTSSATSLKVVRYTPGALAPDAWTLTAVDYLNAYELAQKHEARAVLQLGPAAQTLDPDAIRSLAVSVLQGKTDLAVPHYALPPRAGLVNSAIFYPLTRALYGTRPRFPLALDLCVSVRMAERLASSAQKFTAGNQMDGLVWPVAEAAVAGFVITEVDAGSRVLPQPAGQDLNALLAQITGSLFADIDAKATFWQRARVAPSARRANQLGGVSIAAIDEVQPMLSTFQLAYVNLHEIWSLVLPPQSLLGLKRLSAMPAESFAMPDSLWARIVYDFLLAYRLRTINRGHLLGALTPLYLAWVVSHILQTGLGKKPEDHVESVAAAFEAEKPYLVSRWRWPDRFNP